MKKEKIGDGRFTGGKEWKMRFRDGTIEGRKGRRRMGRLGVVLFQNSLHSLFELRLFPSVV
jgi:hypothetical protein